MEILISSRRVPTFAQRERERERERKRKKSPSFPSPRSCTAQRPSLHCTAAAQLRALFPPPRDCSNSTGEIEARFAYLASPCYPCAHHSPRISLLEVCHNLSHRYDSDMGFKTKIMLRVNSSPRPQRPSTWNHATC